jgi:hypothetical protein
MLYESNEGPMLVVVGPDGSFVTSEVSVDPTIAASPLALLPDGLAPPRVSDLPPLVVKGGEIVPVDEPAEDAVPREEAAEQAPVDDGSGPAIVVWLALLFTALAGGAALWRRRMAGNDG